ncbi:DUF5994 family protein [Streptomyces sp. NBC_00687]|uniref:DUF5994 family protein n=1 Tax=Streptomyces sp. NBC_00687 TaxID=2975807 RepID=UPI0022538103|nr:DUF5994 family protein [Streptomyces sp. NBC_00687]MCX4918921.1 DUF5994 family protein [Streptomyces sp. NBC_00687]
MEPIADATSSTKHIAEPVPVRLSLAPYQAVPGGLDGAWWPYSHQLADELPALIEALDGVGNISVVTLGIEDWSHMPHHVAVGGHVVDAGWFASGRDENVILLLSHTRGFRTLLVIPPMTEAGAAAWLMDTPAPVDGSSTATELLATATDQARGHTG